MIQSMTGYGRATAENSDRTIDIEIKSLNSKSLDLRFKLPLSYGKQEVDFKNLILQTLVRGKIECNIEVVNKNSSTENYIDKNAVNSYRNQILEITKANSDQIPADKLYSMIMHLPDVLKTKVDEIEPQEYEQVIECLGEAIEKVKIFRKQEGKVLEVDFMNRIKKIQSLLVEVEPFEKERVEVVKSKLIKALSKIEEMDYDQNRLEHELIYYIEKFDITEEKVRLENHCKYFLETMSSKDDSSGRKLAFISQEIGREINTIGSKAQNHKIQKIVVQMKDELEKIKEQMANIL